jgi:NADH dehydrogenase [ubiquinone] 1 alpha subcomplex assembly factor 5
MGESNAVRGRRKGFTRRSTLFRAVAAYEELFGGDDGRVPATFQLITMTAWAPHPSQQRPLRPGSGQVNLADFLGQGVADRRQKEP